MIELRCGEESVLTKPMVCTCVLFCHYWYFLHINLRFQPEVCNGFHELIQKAVSFKIVPVKGKDCRTNFWYIRKDETINFSIHAAFTETCGIL